VELFKNLPDKKLTYAADGAKLFICAETVDFESGLFGAWLLGSHEVLIKTPIAPTMFFHAAQYTAYQEHQQSYVASKTYIQDPEHPSRLFHYILVQFPPSHPVENLFSLHPAIAKIDGDFNYFQHPGHPAIRHVGYVEWRLAFTESKVQVRAGPDPPFETPEARAAREAAQRAASYAASYFTSPTPPEEPT
jgi:hypothetical protein